MTKASSVVWTPFDLREPTLERIQSDLRSRLGRPNSSDLEFEFHPLKDGAYMVAAIVRENNGVQRPIVAAALVGPVKLSASPNKALGSIRPSTTQEAAESEISEAVRTGFFPRRKD
jgi:hypothetical protein